LKQTSFLLLLFLFPFYLCGQTNTEFWFAAPEVTSAHGDQPIYLRLTAFGQMAIVTISEPANTPANFPTQVVTIAPNSTVSVDLTLYKGQVECKPPNFPLNYGLHIHADAPITAYYEVANTVNPEIFIMKGNNALGTSFYIPSQDVMYNEQSLNPKAYNTFDIIATEDNTTVTITPKKAIDGHAAGVTFNVVLNQGQVYSAQAVGQNAADHLMGSVVTSDKPVAITMKDDSDHYPGTVCYDLTGDQLVPVNIIGTDYIIVRGSTSSTMNDWVFVLATVDNTHVSVDGSAVATINAGETYHYNMLTSTACTSVHTDQPAYLLHLTGYGCEAGSAVLPAIGCTGSTQVAFTRTTSYTFEMIVLTKAGAQGSFSLDGNPALVTAAMFSSVPGNPAYVYTKITFPASTLPVGAHMLTNSQDIFHMGIIHTYDAGQSGCSYGYFSDFASLNLGPDQTVCPGTPVTFDAGPNRISYAWYFNGAPYATGVRTITVTTPGLYSVTVDDHGCILTDEVLLTNLPAPNPSISGITSFCEGGSQPLTASGTFTSYLWSTGATTQSITVSASGNYTVTVTDNSACHGQATVAVTVHTLPVVTLAQPASACSNMAPYLLTGGSPAGGTWSGPGVNPATGFFDPASGTGPHLITYTYTDIYTCTGNASKTLTVYAPPTVQLAAQPSVCISASPFALTGGTPAGGTYSGPGVNPATGIFTPSSGAGAHLITYTYTDANGCSAIATKTLTVFALPVVTLAPQAPVCISTPPFLLTGGSPAGGIYTGFGVTPATGIFTPSSGTGPHNIIYNYTDMNGCGNVAIQSLVVFPLPTVQMSGQDGACITAPPFPLTCGSPAGGTYSGPGVNSSTGYFDPASGSGPHLITYTYTSINGCTATASKTLTVYAAPDVQLAPLPSACLPDPPFALTGGTPAGGTWSGLGVNPVTGYFDPSSGAGPHTITYTYTDSFGCGGTATGIITVNLLPVVQLQDLPAICISVPPFLLTGGTPAGGTWSGTGVNPVTGMFDPASGAGGHAITYTYVNANGCSDAAVKTLVVNPLPVVQLTGPDAVCISTPPFQLTGGSPAGGIYTGTGVIPATGFFDPALGTGAHTVTYTYTDVAGCINAATKTINVNPLPVIQFSGQDAACISQPPFLLTCGAPAGGTYSGPGVNTLTGMFDPSSGAGPHTISYSYTDAAGCTNSGTKVIMVYALPAVQLADLAAVCISASPFALAGGTPTGGTWSGSGVNTLTGMFDPATGTGIHLITYTYTDGNGCTALATKPLTVNPLPAVQLADQPGVCISVPPYPLSGGLPSGGTYSGIGVNPLTGIFDPSSGAGVHTITFTTTDANSCTNAVTKPLDVFALPVVQLAGMPSVCILVPPFLLTGGTPAGGTYSGTGVTPSTGMFNPSSGAGSHTINYVYSDSHSCTATATNTLTVIPMPVPSGTVSGPLSVCEGAQNNVYLLTGADPIATSFNWELAPAAAGTITGTNSAPVVSYNAGFSGTASIRFQPVSSCGNGNFSGYTPVTVHPKPVVSLQPCIEQVTTRGAKPFPLKGGLPAGGVYSVDGTPLPPAILDPATLSAGPPDHIISYGYTNVFGCAAGATITLAVKNPSGFTCKTTLTDLRDQQTYPTFELVTGAIHRCWTATNLNWGTFITGTMVQSDNCVAEKYCAGNDAAACAASGGLYQWDELMDYHPAYAKGICPPEWHVATEAEWTELENYFQGPGLAGWSLLDPFIANGFHAKTTGVLYQNFLAAFLPPAFSASLFWSSTVNPAGRIYTHGVNMISPSVSTYGSLRSNAFPVRCVRD